MSARDDIRAALAAVRPKRREVEFHGQKFEIQQPSMGWIRNREETGIFSLLIYHSYAPGTQELLFEETDRAWMEAWPADGQIDSLVGEFNALMRGTGTEEARKNSGPDQTDSSSSQSPSPSDNSPAP
jgi:hypothetical protein